MVNKLVLVFIGLFFFSACSSQVDLVITDNGSATMNFKIGLESAFLLYWEDLKELDSQLGASPLETQSILAGMRRYPELRSATLESTSTSQLSGNANITSLTALGNRFVKPGEAPLIELGPGRVTLRLTQVGFQKLLEISDLAQSDALSALLPVSGEPMSEAEFLELVTFSLDPYSDSAEEIAKRSRFILKITAPRAIRTANGAVIRGRTAEWSIPFSRFFQLQNPLILEARY